MMNRIWSPDGTRIYYASERSGPWQIWTRAADGSDEERRISNPADGRK
jgi:Tol biopolymer transport system component